MRTSRALSRSLRGVRAAVALTWIVGCSGDRSATDDRDLVVTEAATFDPDAIVDTASFTDVESLDPDAIRSFLAKTPYEGRSFLAEYHSNGVAAFEAIARASRAHRVNPLVLLVYAQLSEGLVEARTYPEEPDRVEYAFRCGCINGERCLPEYGGFDRQVDCLAQSFRSTLDTIADAGETVTGWAPGKSSLTLDGREIEPADEATAVLYDRLPRVAFRQRGGTWLFWKLYRDYAKATSYRLPAE